MRSLSHEARIRLAISAREDGNMSFLHGTNDEVVHNRESFLAAHGIALDDCVFLRTPHEDEVLFVDENAKGRGTRDQESGACAEALITQVSGTYLCLLTADCFPVAFFDPVKNVIALAHLGWKPASKRLAAKTVSKMAEAFHCDPEHILAFIGPGIGKDSYTMKDCPLKGEPAWQPFLRDLPNGETSVDILDIIRHQLDEVHIIDEHTEASREDTFTSENYFSHRRSRSTGTPEGRFLTVIGLRNSDYMPLRTTNSV